VDVEEKKNNVKKNNDLRMIGVWDKTANKCPSQAGAGMTGTPQCHLRTTGDRFESCPLLS
jgi:hypothetical protein